MLVAAPVAVIAGIELGAASADRLAAVVAAHRLAAGDDQGAIAIDRLLVAQGGFLHLLGHSEIAAAAVAEQDALLDWAVRLAAAGDPDHALAVLVGVTDPAHLAAAAGVRARILLAAAKQAESAGHLELARHRLDELRISGGPASIVTTAAALQPAYDLADAIRLIAAQRAADAVTILDQVGIEAGGAAQGAEARAALPGALLDAARADIAARSYPEAAAFLKRLARDFPGDRAARVGTGLLAAPQRASGTLVDKAGTPFSASVRLGTHFRQTGSGYITSGPFYYSTADSRGDFSFDAIAVGGPYVLEVDRGSGWTALINPATGAAANSFSVNPVEPVDLGFVVLP